MLHMDGRKENARPFLERAAERLNVARDGLEKGTLAREALDRSIEELARFSETVYPIERPDMKRAVEVMESAAEATVLLKHGSSLQCLVCNAMCDVERASLLLWGDGWNVGCKRGIPADNETERVGADVLDVMGSVMLRDAWSNSILDIPQSEDEAMQLFDNAIANICTSRASAHCFGCFKENGTGTVEVAIKSTEAINDLLGEATVYLLRAMRYVCDGPLMDKITNMVKRQAQGNGTLGSNF